MKMILKLYDDIGKPLIKREISAPEDFFMHLDRFWNDIIKIMEVEGND